MRRPNPQGREIPPALGQPGQGLKAGLTVHIEHEHTRRRTGDDGPVGTRHLVAPMTQPFRVAGRFRRPGNCRNLGARMTREDRPAPLGQAQYLLVAFYLALAGKFPFQNPARELVALLLALFFQFASLIVLCPPFERDFTPRFTTKLPPACSTCSTSLTSPTYTPPACIPGWCIPLRCIPG